MLATIQGRNEHAEALNRGARCPIICRSAHHCWYHIMRDTATHLECLYFFFFFFISQSTAGQTLLYNSSLAFIQWLQGKQRRLSPCGCFMSIKAMRPWVKSRLTCQCLWLCCVFRGQLGNSKSLQGMLIWGEM